MPRIKINALLACILGTILFASVCSVLPSFADCASFDSSSNLITVSCSADLEQVAGEVAEPAVLKNENGLWTLNARIEVSDGAKLTINAPATSWLKITGSNGILVKGQIDILGSKITSWDESSAAPIEQDGAGSIPRPYINLYGSEGGTISGAELAYLGYNAVGKRGLDLYGGGASHDLVITGNSKFHDDWRPFYSSSGAYNLVIENSEFYNNNFGYAVDAHGQTSSLRVSNVHVHHNDGIGIICALQCKNVVFENNVVHDNTETGLFFSRQTTDSIIRNNTVYDQPTAFTISIYQSQNNQVYGNKISNSSNGITVHNPAPPDVYGVSAGNKFFNNTFDNVDTAYRALASAENTFSSNTFGQVNLESFYILQSASITIDNQVFAGTKIRAGTGDNKVTIQDSGKIMIDNATYDTNAQAFQRTLTYQTITIDSVAGEQPDIVAPNIAITSPAANQKVPKSITLIYGTASDAASGVKLVEVRVDGGTYGIAAPISLGDWSTWSAQTTISATGTHVIEARATDNAGNQAIYSVSVSVTSADTVKPKVQITSLIDNQVVSKGTLIVTGTSQDMGSGVKTVQVRLDSGSYKTATKITSDWSQWTIQIQINTSGSHKIETRATDNAGNRSFVSVTISAK